MKKIVQRVNQNLLFGILFFAVLYFAKLVLVPLMLGALLAMLMAPLCRSLDDAGFRRALSCAVCIIILLIAFAGVLLLIITELNSFAKDFHTLQHKGRYVLYYLQHFIEERFNIPAEAQVSIAKEQMESTSTETGSLASQILAGLTSTLTTLVLMFVYTFLFLYNKEKYELFFIKLYHNQDTEKVRTIVSKISEVSQRYLTGRVMSIMILTFLYSIALLIIGLENAILLAGIAAILTIIPYVGSTIGGMFPFTMALLTEPTFQPAFMVAAAIILIQTIDNYFIEPNIVGGEVNLNALTSILSIIVGGVVWGIAGMILFIPMVGIFKIICDHVESLKPIGFLIGDPAGRESSKLKHWIKTALKKVGLLRQNT